MYKLITYKSGNSGRYKWLFMYKKTSLAVSYRTYASKSAAIRAFENFARVAHAIYK
jgi:hypothetical protein